MSIQQIFSMIQFSRGTSLVWESLVTPVPAGVIAFSIDDGAFKLGDGVLTYPNLPVLFTYADLVSAQGGVSGLFNEPTVADNGKIVIVSFDTGSGTLKYSVSNTTLASLMTQISTLEAGNVSQDAAIAQLLAIALSINVSINTGSNDEIIVINNGKYASSGTTLNAFQAQVNAGSAYVPGSHLLEPIFYTDVDRKIVVDKLKLFDNFMYFLDVVGFNNNAVALTYDVTANNPDVYIEQVEGSLFSISFNDLTQGVKYSTPVVINVSVDNGTGNSVMSKAIALNVIRQPLVECVFGGPGDDIFYDIVANTDGTFVCVGSTTSNVLSTLDALIVKFDSECNILARKQWVVTGVSNCFKAVAVDSVGNIVVAGYSGSDTGTPSYKGGVVVKFDKNLKQLFTKKFGGVDQNEEFNDVTVDHLDNIICVGSSTVSALKNAIIAKFDKNLITLYKKTVAGTYNDVFYGVAVDTQGKVFAVGSSEESASSTSAGALIVKFDTDLTALIQKRYSAASYKSEFYDVAVDVNDDIVAVGYIDVEGTNNTDGLVVKVDQSLDILYRKRYGGANAEVFNRVALQEGLNPVVVGSTLSEGDGIGTYKNGLFLVLEQNLYYYTKKYIDGASDEVLYGVASDNRFNLIGVGFTASEGNGLKDAFILRTPPYLQDGTFGGSLFTNLIVADSTLSFGTNNTTYDASTLTVSDSTLTSNTLVASAIKDTLVLTKDILN